jgi:hypothetical protein
MRGIRIYFRVRSHRGGGVGLAGEAWSVEEGGIPMTAIAIEEGGRAPSSKLIHIRDGGVVGIATAPGGPGGHPMTAIHVHGYEGFEELVDAEVHLDPDELAKVVRELVQRLPAEHRSQLADALAHPR